MDIEIKTWLYDILNAIQEIESFSQILWKNLLFIKAICERGALLNVILKSLEKQWAEFLPKIHLLNFPTQEK